MSVNSRNRFCIISEVEYELWLTSGLKPTCTEHRHCNAKVAAEMCGVSEYSHYRCNIAKMVCNNPPMIKMQLGWGWKTVREHSKHGATGMTTKQLKPGVATPVNESKIANFTNEKTRTLCRCGKCDRRDSWREAERDLHGRVSARPR